MAFMKGMNWVRVQACISWARFAAFSKELIRVHLRECRRQRMNYFARLSRVDLYELACNTYPLDGRSFLNYMCKFHTARINNSSGDAFRSFHKRRWVRMLVPAGPPGIRNAFGDGRMVRPRTAA